MKIALAKKSQSEGFDFFILNSDNDAKFHYTLKIRNNKPHRFLKDSEFKRPKNAIDLLRKADSVFIESEPEIEKMLDKYQIKYEEKNFCRYCRIEDKVTILRNNQGFQWHGDIICKNCALEQLEKEALSLSGGERAFLADRLLSSLGGEELSDVEAAWVSEVEHRYEEYKRGGKQPIPASEVFEDADRRFK